MKLILCSSFNNSKKNDNNEPYSVKLPISFLDIIKENVLKYKNVVFVANNPDTLNINDKYGNLLFESLKLSRLNFENYITLDSRNKNEAKEIIENADLLFLSGGSIECQLSFFKEIKLDKILNNFSNLIVAGSAGAMNLCKKTLKFPTTFEEIKNITEENSFLDGMGIYNKIFIPHFDGLKKEYIRGKNINAYNELIKLSVSKEFIAVDNHSFIFIKDDLVNYYGNVYMIKNQIVEKL